MQDSTIELRLETPRLRFADLGYALRSGYATFGALIPVSIAYAGIFALFGLVLLSAVAAIGFSAMALPFAGGFMLVGPIVLTGYFELARRHAAGRQSSLLDGLRAFQRAPGGLWLLAALCAFLFLIWITDAGVFYSFTVGGQNASEGFAWFPALRHEVWSFYFWGSLMGSVLAFIIFSISAFSVPLIYEARATAIAAIHASVRTVLGNFPVCTAWGLLLGSIIVLSILLLPLLFIALPVMAYASYALYQRAFPEVHPAGGD